MPNYQVKFIVQKTNELKVIEIEADHFNAINHKMGWYILNNYKIRKGIKIISAIDTKYIK